METNRYPRTTRFLGVVVLLSLLLVATHANAALTARGILADNTQNCTIIAYFSNDGSSSGYVSYYWSAPLSRYIGTNFSIEAGRGYFINCNAADSLAVSGTPISSINDTLYNGWNLYGWVDVDTNSSASEVIDSMGGQSVVQNIAYFSNDGSTSGYISYYWSEPLTRFLGTNFTVETGKGYFIYVNQTVNWTR